jgi:hypothetical protein
VIKLFEAVFNLSFRRGLGPEDREHTGQICTDVARVLRVAGSTSLFIY